MESGDDDSGDAAQPSGWKDSSGARAQERDRGPKRRSGTKGKPGKALTLDSLQAVFSLSLQV